MPDPTRDAAIEAACAAFNGPTAWAAFTEDERQNDRACMGAAIAAYEAAGWCSDMAKAPTDNTGGTCPRNPPKVDLLIEYTNGTQARLPDCFLCAEPWGWCRYDGAAVGPTKIRSKILAWRLPPALPVTR